MKPNPARDFRSASVRDRQAMRDLDALAWAPRQESWVGSVLAVLILAGMVAAMVLL